MDVEITKLNGESFKLSDFGMHVRDFVVGSIEIRPNYAEIEGRNGRIDMGATYGGRSIAVPIYFKGADYQDVALARDQLFELVVSREPFYIREMRRILYHPGHVFEDCDKEDGRVHRVNDYDNLYVGGKRYLVRVSNTFNIEQTFTYGMGDIDFETVGLPFAESIGTTADIDRDGVNNVSAMWGFGMGLQSVDETLEYTHSANSFRIYNAGNVEVEPFECDVKITIKNATKGYKLTNNSSGESFEYSGEVSGTIVLNGPTITVNSLQALRDTNRKYISLISGWNQFTQNQERVVSFDFRFYYQ